MSGRKGGFNHTSRQSKQSKFGNSPNRLNDSQLSIGFGVSTLQEAEKGYNRFEN